MRRPSFVRCDARPKPLNRRGRALVGSRRVRGVIMADCRAAEARDQGHLYYEFRLVDHIPVNHLLPRIDVFVTVTSVVIRTTANGMALSRHFSASELMTGKVAIVSKLGIIGTIEVAPGSGEQVLPLAASPCRRPCSGFPGRLPHKPPRSRPVWRSWPAPERPKASDERPRPPVGLRWDEGPTRVTKRQRTGSFRRRRPNNARATQKHSITSEGA